MPILGLSTVERRPRDRSRSFESTEDQRIPLSVHDLLRRTKFLYRFWWVTHYTTGLAGIVAGALLTAITSSSSGSQKATIIFLSVDLTRYSWLIGIIAAVATSLVTFLGPLHKAERYWSAYHVLEQACLEYCSIEHSPKWDRLMKRVMYVRKILQVVDMDGRLDIDLAAGKGGGGSSPAGKAAPSA